MKKFDLANSDANVEVSSEKPVAGLRNWSRPEVIEISKFSILALGPTPGSTENSTFSNKSL